MKCSVERDGVGLDRCSRNRSGSLCPRATIRHFAFSSPWPRFLSRYAPLEESTRLDKIGSFMTRAASSSVSGRMLFHSSQLVASFSTAAKYFCTLASGSLRISRQGISRSSCLASWRVSRWCGGMLFVVVVVCVWVDVVGVLIVDGSCWMVDVSASESDS